MKNTILLQTKKKTGRKSETAQSEDQTKSYPGDRNSGSQESKDKKVHHSF